ncbi:MAG: hypothetical protein IPI67_05570 [Myxococcales bacterium]|nr:hypothetical protein [Myxococcales bacterium]
MAGDPYREFGPARAADVSRLRRRTDLALGARAAGASLLANAAWLSASALESGPATRLVNLTLPHLAALLMFAAVWIALRSLRGLWAFLRAALLVLSAADFAILCALFWPRPIEVLIIHLWFASALAVGAFATSTLSWHWRGQRGLSLAAGSAGCAFVVLFARVWLGWDRVWPMSDDAQQATFLLLAAIVGLAGCVALLALGRLPVAHEETWLLRGALPTRDVAKLLTFPDGSAHVYLSHGAPREFVGLADAMEWLLDNDYMEEDPRRFATHRKTSAG